MADEQYIPKDIDDSVAHLIALVPAETNQSILQMTEEEFLTGAHFGMAMWTRNQWKLWHGSRLASYFNLLGISHADDMSSIIMKAFYNRLHGKDFDLDEEVAKYTK
jgi:hypothetical protein